MTVIERSNKVEETINRSTKVSSLFLQIAVKNVVDQSAIRLHKQKEM